MTAKNSSPAGGRGALRGTMRAWSRQGIPLPRTTAASAVGAAAANPAPCTVLDRRWRVRTDRGAGCDAGHRD